MSRRTDQRRAAVFALYQHDVTGRELDDVFERDASTFTRALAHAAQDYAAGPRRAIERHAQGWTLDRIAPLEKAIMRVALLEMLHPDAAPGDTPIPPEGAIDEAVETAKTFCGAQAPGFVNGILAAVLREMRENARERMTDARHDHAGRPRRAPRARRRAAALRRPVARRRRRPRRGLRRAGRAGLRRARAPGARERPSRCPARTRCSPEDTLL